MKTSIEFLTSLMAIIFLSSFTYKKSDVFVGTFAVSASDASQIKLVIHADHTFYYHDLSVPNKEVVVNGHWTSNGKKVTLRSNNTALKFHNVWSFAENGQIAKSRKGFCFYRLCKIGG